MTEKYNALESLETYKRNSSTLILLNLKNLIIKQKSNGAIWSDDLLAYLLKWQIPLLEMNN